MKTIVSVSVEVEKQLATRAETLVVQARMTTKMKTQILLPMRPAVSVSMLAISRGMFHGKT